MDNGTACVIMNQDGYLGTSDGHADLFGSGTSFLALRYQELYGVEFFLEQSRMTEEINLAESDFFKKKLLDVPYK